MILPASDPRAPKYWMYESSGRLKPSIERYLQGTRLSIVDMLRIQSYLHQWIGSPVWDANPHLSSEGAQLLYDLRDDVTSLGSRDEIHDWIARAVELGMNPL